MGYNRAISKLPKPLFQSESKCKAIGAFAQKGCGLNTVPSFSSCEVLGLGNGLLISSHYIALAYGLKKSNV